MREELQKIIDHIKKNVKPARSTVKLCNDLHTDIGFFYILTNKKILQKAITANNNISSYLTSNNFEDDILKESKSLLLYLMEPNNFSKNNSDNLLNNWIIASINNNNHSTDYLEKLKNIVKESLENRDILKLTEFFKLKADFNKNELNKPLLRIINEELFQKETKTETLELIAGNNFQNKEILFKLYTAFFDNFQSNKNTELAKNNLNKIIDTRLEHSDSTEGQIATALSSYPNVEIFKYLSKLKSIERNRKEDRKFGSLLTFAIYNKDTHSDNLKILLETFDVSKLSNYDRKSILSSLFYYETISKREFIDIIKNKIKPKDEEEIFNVIESCIKHNKTTDNYRYKIKVVKEEYLKGLEVDFIDNYSREYSKNSSYSTKEIVDNLLYLNEKALLKNNLVSELESKNKTKNKVKI